MNSSEVRKVRPLLLLHAPLYRMCELKHKVFTKPWRPTDTSQRHHRPRLWHSCHVMLIFWDPGARLSLPVFVAASALAWTQPSSPSRWQCKKPEVLQRSVVLLVMQQWLEKLRSPLKDKHVHSPSNVCLLGLDFPISQPHFYSLMKYPWTFYHEQADSSSHIVMGSHAISLATISSPRVCACLWMSAHV